MLIIQLYNKITLIKIHKYYYNKLFNNMINQSNNKKVCNYNNCNYKYNKMINNF